ncbi:SLAM family member 7-like isoform X2 [Clupea harengus]|uniref:SLAM family member 7-like isoform X2 n=1 Tax=Clupea harengus TaxID=7950 RepID=A0A6P8F2S4_CLUHA|nr:SLAM family member 7-like isoform X2 [Clupea harengus]
MMLYLVCLLSPLLLPFLLATAGSSVSVFRPTGGSVTLEFQGHQQLERKDVHLIQWYFGLEKIMIYTPLADTVQVFTHKDRVEFNKETLSLELKNLQKNDSGLYKGEINAGKTDFKAEYSLSVQDPVESPVLSVVSNWSSCDSSNVTVTCRGHDLSLTSTCDCSTCSPEEEHSTDSTITLSVRGGRIICNHSNPVSWTNVTMEINQLCQLCSEQKVTRPGKRIWFILVVVPVCAGIALLIWSKRRRLTAGVGQPQTEYAEVMMSSAPGPPDSAGSTYSTVGLHQPPPPEENPYAEIPKEAQDEDRTLTLPRDSGSSGGVPQTASAESTAASIVSSMQHPHQQTASAPGPISRPQAFMPE